MLVSPLKLNFKFRKILHFSLIIAIVLLQLTLFVLFYNEFYNEAKLDSISKEMKQVAQWKSILLRSKKSQLKAQDNFKEFISTKKSNYYNSYQDDTHILSVFLDSLSKMNANKSWKDYFSKELLSNKNQQQFKLKSDSVFKLYLPNSSVQSLNYYQFKPYNFKDVLNSIEVETEKQVDTVKKKGLFSRLGNALSGKVDVQKEKVNVLITMKFGKEVSVGDVSTQLSKAFEKTNAYYRKAFADLGSNFATKLEEQEKQTSLFASLNLQLLHYSSTLLSSYDKTINDLSDSLTNRFDKQYNTNKTIRNYTIIGLMVLVILISIILMFFTSYAFSYERKLVRAQKTIQRNLSFKNKIVGMISHEIRSPLSILSIYSNFIRTRLTDPEVKDVFNSIQITTNSLLTLSNQILEFSKNENRKMELVKESFNLKEKLVEITILLQTLVESNGNTFFVTNSVPDNAIVVTDLVKIYQLLYNIIGNANKYTHSGEIRIKIDLLPFSPKQFKLNILVVDTGKGIAPEDLAHIFDNFYQGKILDRTHLLGVGLGLTLCKELVALFGGELKIDSEINQGTVVQFFLYIDK